MDDDALLDTLDALRGPVHDLAALTEAPEPSSPAWRSTYRLTMQMVADLLADAQRAAIE